MLPIRAAFASFSTNDISAAKAFYGDKLGLEVRDTPMGVIEVMLETQGMAMARSSSAAEFNLDGVFAAMAKSVIKTSMTSVITSVAPRCLVRGRARIISLSSRRRSEGVPGS